MKIARKNEKNSFLKDLGCYLGFILLEKKCEIGGFVQDAAEI